MFPQKKLARKGLTEPVMISSYYMASLGHNVLRPSREVVSGYASLSINELIYEIWYTSSWPPVCYAAPMVTHPHDCGAEWPGAPRVLRGAAQGDANAMTMNSQGSLHWHELTPQFHCKRKKQTKY